MKTHESLIIILVGVMVFLMSNTAWPQAPKSFKYQAVVRDKAGQVLSNETISLRISVVQFTIDGPDVYQEVHSVTTSELGLVNIEVGRGKSSFGSLAAVDWGSGSHFLSIEMDPAGGIDYELMGVSQLLSVPYALYAEEAGSGRREADLDWEVIGNDVVTGHGGSYPTGNVGIGNNTPGSLLYVAKNTGEPTITVRNLGGAGGATYSMVDDLSGANWKFKATMYGGFKIRDQANSLDVLTIEPNSAANTLYIKTGGNVGIGKNAPAEKLDVTGRVRSDQGFNVNGTNGLNDTTNQVFAFNFMNLKLKYKTFIYSGGILIYTSAESEWVDAVGGFILPPQPVECEGTLVDSRDGKIYATVLIGTQCWMAENLNVGIKVDCTSPLCYQDNDGNIEKYCFDNSEANCDIYGGLYEWREAMQYVTTEGAQGICPAGWHIPTDNEWKVLEGTVDSQYPVGDPVWNQTGWRGLDAGGNLKEAGTSHWKSPNVGATNSSGFTGLPGGKRMWTLETGGFWNSLYDDSYFWSSSQGSTRIAWYRQLYFGDARVFRDGDEKNNGFSIRCLINAPFAPLRGR